MSTGENSQFGTTINERTVPTLARTLCGKKLMLGTWTMP